MRSALLLALVGCFSPTPPTGVPCQADTDCPGAQICHSISHTCELTCDGCSVDAPPTDGDQPVATCWDAWLAGTVDFSPPVKLAQLSPATNLQLANPTVSPDGLRLYFDAGQDLFRATRASITEPFQTGVAISELNTPVNESKISTTADDQIGIFASARNGTVGLLDLWQAERGQGGAFGTPDSSPFANLNDAENQFDPEMTPDGLDLYWAPVKGNAQEINHASRANVKEVFSDPEVIPLSIPGYANYFDPGISPDQRVLVFAARAPSNGPLDLFYTTRSSANAPFGVIREIPLNTDENEGDPDLAADGCTLYFGSNRDGLNAVFEATVRL